MAGNCGLRNYGRSNRNVKEVKIWDRGLKEKSIDEYEHGGFEELREYLNELFKIAM